jgi:hypothetical protein
MWHLVAMAALFSAAAYGQALVITDSDSTRGISWSITIDANQGNRFIVTDADGARVMTGTISDIGSRAAAAVGAALGNVAGGYGRSAVGPTGDPGQQGGVSTTPGSTEGPFGGN